MLFTTSWDDGYGLDLKLAGMLQRYSLTGTFYVCPVKQHGATMLAEQEIKNISVHHEIGAHSIHHPHLAKIPFEQARYEVMKSKEWVETITGKPCTAFCYPYGSHNEAVRSVVHEAGFRSARTTSDLQFRASDPFALPVSLQVTPFPVRKRFSPPWKIFDPLGPLRSRFARLKELSVPLRAMKSWLSLARYLFGYAVETNQEFFHLYGHSREVEKYGMWGDLDQFLQHVAERRGHFKAVPNSALSIRSGDSRISATS